jgi:hypothetical protein
MILTASTLETRPSKEVVNLSLEVLAQCTRRWSIVIRMAMKGICTVADLTGFRYSNYKP